MTTPRTAPLRHPSGATAAVSAIALAARAWTETAAALAERHQAAVSGRDGWVWSEPAEVRAALLATHLKGAARPERSVAMSATPRAAFSMIELALGMAVLALIAGAITPVAVRYVRQEAAQKTAREVLAVIDASKAFYVANTRWPTGLVELKSTGYLPSTFAQSPFGTAYAATVNGVQLQVTVSLPAELAAGATRMLPMTDSATSGGTTTLTSAAVPPGSGPDVSSLLHRQGTLANSTMTGPLQVADQSGSGTSNVRSLGATATSFFEGKVGVGTEAPLAPLQVGAEGSSSVYQGWNKMIAAGPSSTGITAAAGATMMSMVASPSAGGVFTYNYANNTTLPMNLGAASYSFANPASGVWYASIDGGGNASFAGSVSQASDARLKTDVQPLEDGLELVRRLRGVRYSWLDKTRGRARQLGVIAQEVERVVPEVVMTDGAGNKSVDYARLTPVLIEAIKVQQSQIDRLATTTDALTSAGRQARTVTARGEGRFVDGVATIVLPRDFDRAAAAEGRTLWVALAGDWTPRSVSTEVKDGVVALRTEPVATAQRFAWEVRGVRDRR